MKKREELELFERKFISDMVAGILRSTAEDIDKNIDKDPNILIKRMLSFMTTMNLIE